MLTDRLLNLVNQFKTAPLSALLISSLWSGTSFAQVTIAQISDTHLGERHSPHGSNNLFQAVTMINARHPDAVILTGDIGEKSESWELARTILTHLTAPVYYLPGNHDVNSHNIARYRKVFGKDYYRFEIKNVNFLVLNSQLLGNYDKFELNPPAPLSAEMQTEAEKMLAWLEQQTDKLTNRVTIAIQHIPLFHDGTFPDPKPYWTINAPYAQRETQLFHKMGIKHLFAGHWHNGRVFERDGITCHVAPSTSWLPLGGQLGFAVHTITSTGDVHTEFVDLQGATP